jgi:internalin A
MRYFLLMIAVVALVGCGKSLIDDPVVEEAVRKSLKKPEGELTEADLAKVTKLSLAFTKITDAGLKEVAKLQNLTWLYLSNTQITDGGLVEVAKLQNLERLILGGTKTTDAGLKEVAKLQNLERLHLDATKITDAGLKEVAKLQNLTRLSLLGDTQVTKAGAAELKKALPKCFILGP